MSTRDYSIVEYYAEHEGYRCGYCKSTNTNYSHGMWAHTMTVEDYQSLIDRGWRRSGKYCYKPTMNVTCCPMYTIRCEVLDFRISKSQKKVLKKMHRYLCTGSTKASDEPKDSKCQDHDEDFGDGVSSVDIPDIQSKALRAERNLEKTKVASVDPSLKDRIAPTVDGNKTLEAMDVDKIDLLSRGSKNRVTDECKKAAEFSTPVSPKKSPHGDDSQANRPPCKKAKLLRRERKRTKILSQGYTEEEAAELMQGKKSNEPKSLEAFLDEPMPPKPAHRLQIKLVRSSPPSKEFERTSQEAYQLYVKYQMAVHGDPPDKCSERQYNRFLVNSPLKIKLVRSWPSSFEFESTFEESHKLYMKYQMKIHNDSEEECNKNCFLEFLVTSPLESHHTSEGPPQGYGSFHQQYWLGERLIAVGVIDILPYCVSSVYFYYDPDLSELSLGTYASLREIAFTRSLHRTVPALKYYYMGYYIHSCRKMRYKGQYKPSLLLCPEAYTWHSIEMCRPKLDENKYSRFEGPGVEDQDGRIVMNEILVLSHQKAMPYFIYRALNSEADDDEEISQYAKLAGMKCARKMLLVRM